MLQKGMLIMFLFLFITLSCFARSVKTQACTKQNLSDLRLVESGGMWQKDKKMGYYRIMVYLLGWDHPQNVIQFQIMYRNQIKGRIDLTKCTQIIEGGKRSPVIFNVKINEFSNTQAWVRLDLLRGPFPASERFQIYLLDINGNLTRHHR